MHMFYLCYVFKRGIESLRLYRSIIEVHKNASHVVCTYAIICVWSKNLLEDLLNDFVVALLIRFYLLIEFIDPLTCLFVC